MLALLPVARVITVVAVLYAAITLALAALLSATLDLEQWQTVTLAFSGATALQLTLLFVLNHAWKWIWHIVPALNHALFPNIEGRWKMQIDWQRGDESGQVMATAVIKQTFLKLSMEVDSVGSESETRVALPKRDHESGSAGALLRLPSVPKGRKVGCRPSV